MKVLHINSYYIGSNFYRNLYDKQLELGIDLDVFVPVPISIDPSIYRLGDYTTISANHGKYDRIIFYLKHWKIFNDIVQNYKIQNYSMIHAHSLFSNGYIAMKLKKKFNKPYIVAVRNTDVNTFFKRMPHLRKLGVSILKEANKVIFLSESYKEIVLRKYIPNDLKRGILDKVEVIPNGIDNFWFINKGIPKHLPEGMRLKFLYVGVINKNKNITTTIKAMEYLQKEGFNVTFTIIGRIEDDSIYQKIKDTSNVNYVSSMQKEDLIKIFCNHDFFVMPSKTESFGLVYAEAMSQGLPIIYSKGQGFDGQFEEGMVGFHVNSQHPHEIKDKVIEIIKDYYNIRPVD
ncbi:glycosyltransferase family 4 protein [Paenibacillus sp. JSM ZJ436]|uniref:glycosyltransferase family 4 protein n=1 Tax=Paenibacillus sp. JSM ZJ436 TaxID=3376190 RepID=UPI0037B53B13